MRPLPREAYSRLGLLSACHGTFCDKIVGRKLFAPHNDGLAHFQTNKALCPKTKKAELDALPLRLPPTSHFSPLSCSLGLFLAASTISDSRHEDRQSIESGRRPGKGGGVASRRQSTTDADWTGRDRAGPERRVGSRDHRQADEPRAAQGGRESWQRSERNTTTDNADTNFGLKEGPSGGRRRSRVSLGSPATEGDVEGSHERLLWDDLRESLEGATGGERVPARSTWARGVAVEKSAEERDRELRRRRLIDEAIAVLLEGSSSSGSGSSDDERLEDGAL